MFLAACGDGGDAPVQAQRISLDDARARPSEPLASPDTEGAAWTVRANGLAVDFGQEGGAPLLSLECRLRREQMTIVRHVPARPGQEALFPVMGNGLVSRFKVDAALADGEWRWQGVLPVGDPQLDVFVGTADLEATLPGGGMLTIEGSRIPGEFVSWCRSGGETAAPEDAEETTSVRPEPVGSAAGPAAQRP
jgi:hypothetical protein